MRGAESPLSTKVTSKNKCTHQAWDRTTTHKKEQITVAGQCRVLTELHQARSHEYAQSEQTGQTHRVLFESAKNSRVNNKKSTFGNLNDYLQTALAPSEQFKVTLSRQSDSDIDENPECQLECWFG